MNDANTLNGSHCALHRQPIPCPGCRAAAQNAQAIQKLMTPNACVRVDRTLFDLGAERGPRQ